MIRFEATGAKDCFRLARALNEAGERGLKRELDKASRTAGRFIADAILEPSSLNRFIPQHFEQRFGQAVTADVQVRLVQSRRISVVVYADGKKQRRDIVAMNRGLLRHPVHRRMRRLTAGGRYVPAAHQDRIAGDFYHNPWDGQRIRPGLVDDPAQQAMPKAVEQIEDAVTRVVEQIGRA